MLENVTFCKVDKLVNLCFINFNTAPTHTPLKRFFMAPFVSEPAAVTKLVEPLNNYPKSEGVERLFFLSNRLMQVGLEVSGTKLCANINH